MTQPNVTALSVPAGPRNSAAFVASTTAPPTFVFRPGATFPAGGIGVQQNVFTTPVSVGVDGLVMLQGVLAGNGLAPAIPLPSSVVQLDFSLTGNAFSFTGNVSFGKSCSLEGLFSPGNYPTLTSNGHTVGGIVEFTDLIFQVSVATAVPTPPGILTLRGKATVESIDAHLYSPAITGGTPLTVNVYDASTLGDATHAVWNVNAGGTLTVNAYDAAQLKAGALSTAGGGNVIINVYSPGVFVDPSYTVEANVTININYASSTALGQLVTFQPGGASSGTTFTTFAAVCAYIASVGTDVEKWTIQIDGSFTGGSPSIASGTYALPNSVEFVGLANPAYGFPTLSAGSDLVLDPPPTDLSFINLPFIEFLNITNPLVTVTGQLDVYVFNCFLFGNLWFSSVTGGFVNVTLDTYSSINSADIIKVDATSNAVVGALPGTTVAAGAITVADGGSCPIFVTDSVTVDPSYFFNATGISVNYLYAPAPIATFQPGGTNTPVVFTDQDQFSGYFSAVALVPKWTAQFDFSKNADVYTITDQFFIGDSTTLVGIFNETNGLFPTLIAPNTANVWFSPAPIEVRDINLVATGGSQGFFNSPNFLTLRGNTFFGSGSATPGGIVLGADITTTLVLQDSAIIGEGTHPVIGVSATGVLNIYVSSLPVDEGVPLYALAANAIQITPGGLVNIFCQFNSQIDPSYFSLPGVTVTVQQTGTNPSLVFQPGGTPNSNVFVDEASLAAATSLFNGAEYTIFFDGSFVGDVYTFTTNGTLFLAPNGTWTSVNIELLFVNGTVLANPPIHIKCQNDQFGGMFISVGQPQAVCVVTEDGGTTFEGFVGIATGASNVGPFIDVQGAAEWDISFYGNTNAAGFDASSPTFTGSAGTLKFFIYDSASIFAFASDATLAFLITASPNASVDGATQPFLYSVLSTNGVGGMILDAYGTGVTTIPANGPNSGAFLLSISASKIDGALYESNGTTWIPISSHSGSTTMVNGVSPAISAYVTAGSTITATYKALNGSVAIGTLIAKASDRTNGNPGSFKITSLTTGLATVVTDQSTIDWRISP